MLRGIAPILSCGAVLALVGGMAVAETPEGAAPGTGPSGYPEFTFKRISAPSATAAKRITVQIDPEEQARRLATGPLPPAEHPIPRGGAAPGLEPSLPQPSAYDWYWEKVSPVLGNRDGRFATALAALTQGPDGTQVAAPRLGVADSANPVDNIRGGVAYLDWLMKEFDRDPLMVLAAYNAGENAVKSNGGVPPYAETRAYVPKVLAAWSVARGLCVTPPELVTDGCVFAVKG